MARLPGVLRIAPTEEWMETLLRRLAITILFLLAATAAYAQTFTGAMSGSWWDASRGGEGQLIAFETTGGRNVASLAYFTYTADGRATWHVGNVDYTPGATSLTIPLVTGSGARFGTAFNAGDVRIAPAGTATLEFVSCSRLRLRHSGMDGVVLELTRLVGPLVDADCDATAPAVTNAFTGVVSGSWWNAGRGGEGQFITFERQGSRNVAFLAYFTYTADGAASWLVGNADFTAGARSVTIPLVTGSGARFGTAFRAQDVMIANAGSATIEFANCQSMRLTYSGTPAFSHGITRLAGPLGGLACTDPPATPGSASDLALRPLLAAGGQAGNARAGRRIPSIDDPLPQLGKLLFFSKALSGDLDTACASCHHPSLAGADGLSLSIGAGAERPEVMGPGRRLANGGFSTARNANTFFNVALWDKGLFHDARVESLAGTPLANGAGGGIRTPDSPFGTADPNAGPTLPAAQARFPVVSASEMKGAGALAGLPDAEVRARLAARLGNYGAEAGTLRPSQWLQRFRSAFASPAGTPESLITFDNIALAIAEYQRSATFTDNPWARYVQGDNDAINEQAKLGALRFFQPSIPQGGANCVQCHRGDAFTNERPTAVGFPQVGPGMGDGTDGTADFGRQRASGQASDRFLFRTPSLLNVELTAPYGHSGHVGDLGTVIRHYVIPEDTLGRFLQGREWCALPSFAATPGCNSTFAAVSRNSSDAFSKVESHRFQAPSDAMPALDSNQFSPTVAGQIEAFLRTLTDPCLRDRACFGRWIPRPDEAPDEHQLNATSAAGSAL